jgi:hypothetical protein
MKTIRATPPTLQSCAKTVFGALFQHVSTTVSIERTSLTKLAILASACFTAVCLLLSGALAQAQPTLTAFSPDGSVQFQSAAPSPNTLTFTVNSSTGVTNLSVLLTGTGFLSVVGGWPVATTVTLTTNNGLVVSGPSTSENVVIPLGNDMTYNATITAADAGGVTVHAMTFDTISTNYYTFEAEDYDYSVTNGMTVLDNQFFDNPQIDSYAGLGAAYGIDYQANPGGGSTDYRPQGMETENWGRGGVDKKRPQYVSSGLSDYDVGHNNGGDWADYTRTYPAGLYNIWVRICGGSQIEDSISLGLLSSGLGTTNQMVIPFGTANSAGLGWDSHTFEPVVDTNGNLVAWAAAGDVETIRYHGDNTGCNLNYYMLLPAVPVISPNITNIYQGASSVTLIMNGIALKPLTYQWQTDNGTHGATWSDVSEATNTTFLVPNSSQGTFEYQVVVANTSMNFTSAPVTLMVIPGTKPVIVNDTTPASASGIVGSIFDFTASFVGTLPIYYQWEVSTDGGLTFNVIPNQTNSTLWVTNLAVGTNEYELVATNLFGSGHSTPATVTVTPTPTPIPVQIAGDLIVNLQSVDLSSSYTAWTNQTGFPTSVGNFAPVGGGFLSVSQPPFWQGLPINGLYVNDNIGYAVQSELLAPMEIISNGACSAEAWVYRTAGLTSGGGDNCVVIGYGVQGGGAAPKEDRAFDLYNGEAGAVSGNGGNLDTPWTAEIIADEWYYVTYTWDGTNTFTAYLNGVEDVQTAPGPLNTQESYLGVGGGPGQTGITVGGDAYHGWISAARVMSGVLTASQVSNNFAAGPFAVVPAVAAQNVSLGYSFSGGVVTLTWPTNAALEQATSLMGPWTTNSAPSPYVIHPTSGGPTMFYRLEYSSQ